MMNPHPRMDGRQGRSMKKAHASEGDICMAVRQEITAWLENNTYCDYDEFVWGLLDEAIARGVSRAVAGKMSETYTTCAD